MVGKMTATSRGGARRVSASDGQITSKDLYALVRTNTTRVKIDDQWDILATVSDPMVEKARSACLKLPTARGQKASMRIPHRPLDVT